MAAKKGTIAAVKFQLRKGLSLPKACEAAKYSINKLWYWRKKDPKLDAEIKSLMGKRKSLRSTGINLTGRGVKQVVGADEYWEKWNAAAGKGTLRRKYGLHTAKVRPPVRRRIVL